MNGPSLVLTLAPERACHVAQVADDAQLWYTDNASAMTDTNSYQLATVSGADRSTLDAGDFNLKN